jgi:hypothetical protein
MSPERTAPAVVVACGALTLRADRERGFLVPRTSNGVPIRTTGATIVSRTVRDAMDLWPCLQGPSSITMGENRHAVPETVTETETEGEDG